MEVLTDVDEARIRAHLEDDDFFWLDLTAPGADAFARVGNMLGLHEINVEAAVEAAR